MKCLVTAGNTQALIDRVRCITNIFTGRTGTKIALELVCRGHEVILLTSHAELIDNTLSRCKVVPYRTFEDLEQLMKSEITKGGFDAVIHCAAVSDYLSEGVYVPSAGTRFDVQQKSWHTDQSTSRMLDVSANKVKSTHEELWLRFVKAPKLVDKIRAEWGYSGKLVKFKLEVGVDRQALETIAESSRLQSQANWMVANTLEGMNEWALLGPVNGSYVKIERTDLANRLIDQLELS